MLEAMICPVPENPGMTYDWADAITLKYATPAAAVHTVKGTIFGVDLEVYNHLGVLVYSANGSDATGGAPYTFNASFNVQNLRFRTKIRPTIPLTSERIGIEIQFNGFPASININEVSDWEKAKLRMMLLTYADKLTKVPSKLSPNFRQVRLLGSTIFNDPAVADWNTENLTTLSNLFMNCPAFNQSLQQWDTSNVTSMDYTFSGCTKFNSVITLWNVKKVTSMTYMFNGCINLNQDYTNLVFKARVNRYNYDTNTPKWSASYKPKFNGT